MEIKDALLRAQEAAAPEVGSGRLAEYIPGLASVDPLQFGMAVASCDGEVHAVGDADVPFSVQSISKVFTLALVIAAEGERIWGRVSREPSGNPFNSLLQLDQEAGRPRNPFINAGALVVTDRLQALTGDAFGTLRDLMRRESGRGDVDSDPDVARSELEAGHRTSALAHLLASYGNLECPVDRVIEQYVAQCALSMTCRELALAGLFLARDGVLSDAYPAAQRARGEAGQRRDAHLRHLRLGRRLRLPGRTAGQERRRWRHPGRHPRPGCRLRVEPHAGAQRQLGSGVGGAGCLHHVLGLDGLLILPRQRSHPIRWASTGVAAVVGPSCLRARMTAVAISQNGSSR